MLLGVNQGDDRNVADHINMTPLDYVAMFGYQLIIIQLSSRKMHETISENVECVLDLEQFAAE